MLKSIQREKGIKMNSKIEILNEIEKNCEFFKKIAFDQYKMKCPFCGDTDKENHGHLYLKCTNDINEPILYHCFLCNAGGRVNKAFLDKFNIKLSTPETINYFNKLSKMKGKHDISEGIPNLDSPQYKYLANRLHAQFTIEELSKFRIVWDMAGIDECITSKRVKNTLPSNIDSISFFSDNNCVLLTRFFDNKLRWRKTTLFPSNRAFYSIRKDIDLFQKDIHIHIAEGVFDVLSLYKNFYHENGIYLATLGSEYCGAIDHVSSLGLFGSNVTLHFYLDKDIDEKFILMKLKKMRWAFNNIRVYKNTLSKDIGVPKDQIKLIELS